MDRLDVMSAPTGKVQARRAPRKAERGGTGWVIGVGRHTLVNDTLEPCGMSAALNCTQATCKLEAMIRIDLLITLNNLLEIAAAAIVHRMMIRSKPLVFFPVIALRRGSAPVSAMMAR